MQLFNKASAKKTFAHTWYIYPLLGGIITVIWLWAFYAFHQPTKHEMLTLFFSTNVKSDKFVSQIMKHYAREDLREVSTSGRLPEASGYYAKLQTAFSDSDLLILDDTTIGEFVTVYDRVFHSITDDIKTEYFPNVTEYYVYEYGDEESQTTVTLGALLKRKGEDHYLTKYMDFDELRDYYVLICRSSKNAGRMSGASNKNYDNALTFMNYLLEL